MAIKKDDEAVGDSLKFSFEEALENAINALPPTGADIVIVKVLEIGAEIGGFAGTKKISVKVKRVV